MKIRASKLKANTEYDYDDYLLKEFSTDKEKFIPDLELSCCLCYEQENEVLDQDSILSFLVKFKADNMKDPQIIKPGLKGYLLPENLNYEFKTVASTFKSIQENHYNLLLDEKGLLILAKKMFKDKVLSFSSGQLDNYIIGSCDQRDWKKLYELDNKKEWKKHLRKKLRQQYDEAYGKFELAPVKEAYEMDPGGVVAAVKLLKQFDFLNPDELTLIDSVIG